VGADLQARKRSWRDLEALRGEDPVSWTPGRLHAFDRQQGRRVETIERFMRYTVSLGADSQLWVRSQFVRTPDGINRNSGERQTVFYLDPQKILSVKATQAAAPAKELQPESSIYAHK
jgi:hypothetical protein